MASSAFGEAVQQCRDCNLPATDEMSEYIKDFCVVMKDNESDSDSADEMEVERGEIGGEDEEADHAIVLNGFEAGRVEAECGGVDGVARAEAFNCNCKRVKTAEGRGCIAQFQGDEVWAFQLSLKDVDRGMFIYFCHIFEASQLSFLHVSL